MIQGMEFPKLVFGTRSSRVKELIFFFKMFLRETTLGTNLIPPPFPFHPFFEFKNLFLIFKSVCSASVSRMYNVNSCFHPFHHKISYNERRCYV